MATQKGGMKAAEKGSAKAANQVAIDSAVRHKYKLKRWREPVRSLLEE